MRIKSRKRHSWPDGIIRALCERLMAGTQDMQQAHQCVDLPAFRHFQRGSDRRHEYPCNMDFGSSKSPHSGSFRAERASWRGEIFPEGLIIDCKGLWLDHLSNERMEWGSPTSNADDCHLPVPLVTVTLALVLDTRTAMFSMCRKTVV